jgi:hypothetical protein
MALMLFYALGVAALTQLGLTQRWLLVTWLSLICGITTFGAR